MTFDQRPESLVSALAKRIRQGGEGEVDMMLPSFARLVLYG
jgi:hypothetical protein